MRQGYDGPGFRSDWCGLTATHRKKLQQITRVRLRSKDDTFVSRQALRATGYRGESELTDRFHGIKSDSYKAMGNAQAQRKNGVK